MWVLTFEVNEYDQCGEYFQAVFKDKPNGEQLIYNGVPPGREAHVLSGGGRVGSEYEWYYLREYEG